MSMKLSRFVFQFVRVYKVQIQQEQSLNPNHLWSATWFLFCQSTRSNVKSPYRSQSFMSFCVADVYVNFGLPIPLAWLRLISSHVLTGVLRDLRCTWPNQLTSFALNFSFILHQNFWIRETIIIKIRNFRFAGCELWHKNNCSSARSVFLMVKPWTNSIACYSWFQEEWKKKEAYSSHSKKAQVFIFKTNDIFQFPFSFKNFLQLTWIDNTVRKKTQVKKPKNLNSQRKRNLPSTC